MAGSLTFLDDILIDVQKAGILEAVAKRNTPKIFDWLLNAFSYQGIYARGNAFIPNIKRDLYDKLLAAIGSSQESLDSSQVEGATPGDGVAHAPTEAGAILPPLASGLPQTWESIAAGNMILSHEGPGEGWWEAIVISRDDEILTLRYRDYPKVPKFERHVSTVALINPKPA